MAVNVSGQAGGMECFDDNLGGILHLRFTRFTQRLQLYLPLSLLIGESFGMKQTTEFPFCIHPKHKFVSVCKLSLYPRALLWSEVKCTLMDTFLAGQIYFVQNANFFSNMLL